LKFKLRKQTRISKKVNNLIASKTTEKLLLNLEDSIKNLEEVRRS